MFDSSLYDEKMSKTLDIFIKELSSLRTEEQTRAC